MIWFSDKKIEEPKKELEKHKQTINSIGNANDDRQNITQDHNRQENFLDYDVNTNSNNNKKSNFFDDGDVTDEVFNKSQNFSNQSKPVTGENARAKTPNQEHINQFLNPESGATQNIEKNNKNNFFDDGDDTKNTFNLFSSKQEQSTHKSRIPDKKISGGNINHNVGYKSHIEKKIEQNFPQKISKQPNLQPKNDVINFSLI